MVLCAELSGTHGGHTGRACYNLISAALLLQSKEQQEAFFKVFSFSLLLKVRKEVPAEGAARRPLASREGLGAVPARPGPARLSAGPAARLSRARARPRTRRARGRHAPAGSARRTASVRRAGPAVGFRGERDGGGEAGGRRAAPPGGVAATAARPTPQPPLRDPGVPARRSLAHQGLPAGPLPGERLAAGLRAADAGGDAAAVGAGPGLAAAVPRLPQRLVPAAGDLHPQHRL